MTTHPLAPLLLLLASAHAAAETINQVRPIDADGSVEISNQRGEIRVIGSERGDLAITGELGEGASGLKIEGDGRRLRIEVDYPDEGGWFSGWGVRGNRAASNLVVELPASVSVTVKSVAAAVDVGGLRGRRAELGSVSGRIRFDGSVEQLSVESVSGSAQVKGASRRLTLNSVSGELVADMEVSERLDVETVSGRVKVTSPLALADASAASVSGDLILDFGLGPNARVDAESVSGDISLQLPAAASARLRAETFSGGVRSDVGRVIRADYGPGERLDTELGRADGDIRLETFSGDIRVRLKDEGKPSGVESDASVER